MILSIGPLTAHTDESGDVTMLAPEGTREVHDLAPIPLRTEERMALLVSEEPLPGCDVLEEKDLTTARDAMAKHFGYRPEGASLVDLVRRSYTAGSDPSGDAFTCPLMPTNTRKLEVWLGNQRVYGESFAFGVHEHSGQVQALAKLNFARALTECRNVATDLRAAKAIIPNLWTELDAADPRAVQHVNELRRKGLTCTQARDALEVVAAKFEVHPFRVLDATCEKYRLDDWREVVPRDLHGEVPGRVKHETTTGDTFDRANESPAVGWTSVGASNFDVVSNAARAGSTNTTASRWGTPVSSDDHYAEVTVTEFGALATAISGACARCVSSAAYSCYQCVGREDGQKRTDSVSAGVATPLSTILEATTEPLICKPWCNGSTIRGFFNGVARYTTTNTTHTGNLYGGMRGAASGTAGNRSILDSFSLADLVNLVRYNRPLLGAG